MIRWRLLAVFALCGLAGCASVRYYWQSIDGQIQLLAERQSIAVVIANPNTDPALKAKLARVLEIRDFASSELKLPDNPSYRGYADLRRSYVVWNVYATPEFSIAPEQWCFPIAGCVNYRGYFALADAGEFADGLREQAFDVFISGVPAYSTLGWFDDPVLNTFISYQDYEVSRLIFHELAHQVVYVGGDSEFNESFAATVETEGVRRWIVRHGDARMQAAFESAQQRRTDFRALIVKYRAALADIYRLPITGAQMRSRKSQAYSDLERDYQQLKTSWGGYAGYDRFMEHPNNATLASFALYSALVPEFQRILERNRGDLAAFYADVKALAALGKEQRKAQFAALEP